MPSVAPTLRILYFLPFLIITMYQKTLIASLCYALGCGLIFDLLTADLHFGMHALSYSLTMLILYEQKKNFFSDNVSTLPIMTFFFSVLLTLIDSALFYALQQPPVLSRQWIGCNLFMMPCFDALFAFVFFIAPSIIFGKRVRKGEEYFNSKIKS